jgi:type II secretory pathway component PulK
MDFRPPLKKAQRGSALIFAMGLCTLVVILATSMLFSLHHDMRRYDRLQSTVAEQAAIRSATAWALSVIHDENVVDKVAAVKEITLNDIDIKMSMIDIDGLFNINTIISDENTREFGAISIFKRLSEVLTLDAAVLTAVTQRSTPFQTLDALKIALKLPVERYNTLVSYIRANEDTDRAMNVNTMPPALMAALLSVDDGVATALRSRGPYESEADFTAAMYQLSIPVPAEGLSDWLKYDSQQYLVVVDIKAKGVVRMYTLLAHTPEGWQVIYQSTGVRL